jgi:hypothetical protein
MFMAWSWKNIFGLRKVYITQLKGCLISLGLIRAAASPLLVFDKADAPGADSHARRHDVYMTDYCYCATLYLAESDIISLGVIHYFFASYQRGGGLWHIFYPVYTLGMKVLCNCYYVCISNHERDFDPPIVCSFAQLLASARHDAGDLCGQTPRSRYNNPAGHVCFQLLLRSRTTDKRPALASQGDRP